LFIIKKRKQRAAFEGCLKSLANKRLRLFENYKVHLSAHLQRAFPPGASPPSHPSLETSSCAPRPIVDESVEASDIVVPYSLHLEGILGE